MNQVPRLAAILFLLLGSGVALRAHPAAPSVSPSPSEQVELMKARRRNEEAQAEYYLAQAKRLEAPAKKSFSQGILENPVSVAGFIGASFAALVALLTFLLNYKATVRAQRDAQ